MIGRTMELLKNLQTRLLGDEPDPAALQEASRKLAADLAALDAQRAELTSAIESAQTAADRKTIRDAQAAVAKAQAAADRERSRIEAEAERQRAVAIERGLAELADMLDQHRSVLARWDAIAAAFVDLERQGRILWAEFEVLSSTVDARGEAALRRTIDRKRADLAALGARDVPAPAPAKNEVVLLRLISAGVRRLLEEMPLRGPTRSVLAAAFSRAIF